MNISFREVLGRVSSEHVQDHGRGEAPERGGHADNSLVCAGQQCKLAAKRAHSLLPGGHAAEVRTNLHIQTKGVSVVCMTT